MLIVNGEGTTMVTVTLYEKCNLPNPYFTWQVQRKGSLDQIIFYQDDISMSPYYFNQFNLIVATTSVGLTAGVVPLTPGEWNYYVWEQSSPYILATSSNMVETGLLIVTGTYSQDPIYNGLDTNTIPIYRG